MPEVKQREGVFNKGFLMAAALAAYLGQIFYLGGITGLESCWNLIPVTPLVTAMYFYLFYQPLSRLFRKLPLGADDAVGGPNLFRRGLGWGLVLSLLGLALLAWAAQSRPSFPFMFLLGSLISLPCWVLLRSLKPWAFLPNGPIDPQTALEPLRSASFFGRHHLQDAAHQAARPETWAGQWPDEPRVIEARDRMNRLLRYYGEWPSNAFLPDDDLGILLQPRKNGEYLDPIELVMSIEELFDVKISDEALYGAQKGGETYLAFLRRVADNLPPDYPGLLDAEGGRPLSVPDDFYEDLSWRERLKHKFTGLSAEVIDDSLRLRQVLRSPRWRERWPETGIPAEPRDRVGRMLARKFGWLDEAFLPDDQLRAILHTPRGLRDLPAGLLVLKRELGLELTVAEVVEGRLTFLDLLRRINQRRPPGQ